MKPLLPQWNPNETSHVTKLSKDGIISLFRKRLAVFIKVSNHSKEYARKYDQKNIQTGESMQDSRC